MAKPKKSAKTGRFVKAKSSEKAETPKSSTHARLLAQYRAAEKEIKIGERVMRASKTTLRSAGRVLAASQKIDKLGAQIIVQGVKSRSKLKERAAKKGWL